MFKAQRQHNPKDLDQARILAARTDKLRLGIFYKDGNRPVYNEIRAVPPVSPEEKVKRLEKEFDRYAV
jgi:hypothetical protein